MIAANLPQRRPKACNLTSQSSAGDELRGMNSLCQSDAAKAELRHRGISSRYLMPFGTNRWQRRDLSGPAAIAMNLKKTLKRSRSKITAPELVSLAVRSINGESIHVTSAIIGKPRQLSTLTNRRILLTGFSARGKLMRSLRAKIFPAIIALLSGLYAVLTWQTLRSRSHS